MVAPRDQPQRMAHVVAAVVRPTLAKAQVLVVALAPIACRLGMSVSPAVTTAAAVHEPSSSRPEPPPTPD